MSDIDYNMNKLLHLSIISIEDCGEKRIFEERVNWSSKIEFKWKNKLINKNLDNQWYNQIR